MKNKSLINANRYHQALPIALVKILKPYFEILNDNKQYTDVIQSINNLYSLYDENTKVWDFTHFNYRKYHNEMFLSLHNIKNKKGYSDDRLLLKKPLVNTNWGTMILDNKLDYYSVSYERYKKFEEYGIIDKVNKVVVFEDLVELLYSIDVFGVDNVLFITSDKYLEKVFDGKKVKCLYINMLTCKYDIDAALEIYDMKNIDFIIGNPPYSKKEIQTTKRAKHVDIWKTVVEVCLDKLSNGGYLSLVHPNGWRSGGKQSISLFNKMTKENTMLYLEMHDKVDGEKHFNASTTYDWYIIKKEKPTTKNIDIKDQSGVEHVITNDYNFIPSSNYDLIYKLLAKDGEEKVDIMYDRSMYGSDKKNMNKEQTEEFKYPCVYYVKQDGTLENWYSSVKKEQFGIPKVIVSSGEGYEVFQDLNGDYGLTQFACGIVDTVENLGNIKKALISDSFKPVLEATKLKSAMYNRNIIKHFRKDFWKEFV